MQRHWLNLGHLLTAAEHVYEATTQLAEAYCDATGPPTICIGGGLGLVCFPNPVKTGCKIVVPILVTVAYVALIIATIAYQVYDDIYTLATLGENQAIYGYYYARAAYFNTFEYNKWNR